MNHVGEQWGKCDRAVGILWKQLWLPQLKPNLWNRECHTSRIPWASACAAMVYVTFDHWMETSRSKSALSNNGMMLRMPLLLKIHDVFKYPLHWLWDISYLMKSTDACDCCQYKSSILLPSYPMWSNMVSLLRFCFLQQKIKSCQLNGRAESSFSINIDINLTLIISATAFPPSSLNCECNVSY